MFAIEVVECFANYVDWDVVIVANKLAIALASSNQAVLCLVKHDQLGVQDASPLLGEREMRVTTNVHARYALHVYNNPKVGGKALCVVPVLTSCIVEEEHTLSKTGKRALVQRLVVAHITT